MERAGSPRPDIRPEGVHHADHPHHRDRRGLRAGRAGPARPEQQRERRRRRRAGQAEAHRLREWQGGRQHQQVHRLRASGPPTRARTSRSSAAPAVPAAGSSTRRPRPVPCRASSVPGSPRAGAARRSATASWCQAPASTASRGPWPAASPPADRTPRHRRASPPGGALRHCSSRTCWARYAAGGRPWTALKSRVKCAASGSPHCAPMAETGRVTRAGSTRSCRHRASRRRRTVRPPPRRPARTGDAGNAARCGAPRRPSRARAWGRRDVARCSGGSSTAAHGSASPAAAPARARGAPPTPRSPGRGRHCRLAPLRIRRTTPAGRGARGSGSRPARPCRTTRGCSRRPAGPGRARRAG